MNRTILTTATLIAALGLTGCAGGGTRPADDAAEVAATTLTQLGQTAPDFTLPILGGGTFRLADQRGKVVLVNFFATWCGPCREEIPHLKAEVWQRYAGRQFALVSVAREENAAAVAPFVNEYGMAWTVALDEQRTAFASYAEAFIPRNYVVDATGTIVYQSQGYDAEEFAALVATVDRELAKTDAASLPSARLPTP